jgi:hypothetical protein
MQGFLGGRTLGFLRGSILGFLGGTTGNWGMLGNSLILFIATSINRLIN